MRVYNICVYASYRVFESILGYAEPVIERLCFFFENKKFFIFFSSVSYTFRAGRGNAAVFVDYAVVNTTGKNKLSAESVPYLFRTRRRGGNLKLLCNTPAGGHIFKHKFSHRRTADIAVTNKKHFYHNLYLPP